MASRATASQRGKRAARPCQSARIYPSFPSLVLVGLAAAAGPVQARCRRVERTLSQKMQLSSSAARSSLSSRRSGGGAPSQRGEEEATAVASVSESAAAAAAKAFVNITLRDRVLPSRVTWVGSAVAAGSKRRQGSRAAAVPLPRRESGERLGRR